MKSLIIPAIIAKTPKELPKRTEKVLSLTNFFQLDVMDGMFVDSISLYPILPHIPTKHATNNKINPISYEAHLMVNSPLLWIKKNDKLMQYVTTYIIHSEIPKLDETLTVLKKSGKNIGLALNPETPISEVKKYLSRIDKLLIMTVHPGQYGSSFLTEMLDKISEARKIAPKLNIEVDGGINPDTIELCKEAGANQFVVGSFLQNSSDVKKAWVELTKLAQ